jgi:aspartate aminotransferase
MFTPALSERINTLSESETLAMTRRSRELELKGLDVINLSIGQPDFDTPDFIKDAAIEGMQQGYTSYPPVAGYLDLRKAICAKFKRDNGLEYEPDQIVVSTGAKQSLANAILSLVNPGDEVIVPAPYWVSYKEMIKLAEGQPVYIQGKLENDFKVTPDQVEEAITSRSRIFIFSSPCNPTGSVYTKEELYALAKVFEKREHIFIISDEIYELINFDGRHESIAQFDFIKDRVITINGLSKGFAMTGWRLGYMAAHKVIAKACDKIQGQITSGANSIAQRAAIKALEVDPADCPDVLDMREEFKARRELLLELLQDIPGLITYMPQGAFYLFPNVTYYYGKQSEDCRIENGNDLCMYLLDKAQVALVPGDAFGCPTCIRLSYATSREKIREAVNRIKEALARLH